MTLGGRWLCAVLVALGAVGACHATARSTDGNTSWLRQCTSSADCDGLDCECGVCTTSCARDRACSSGTCAMPGSRAFDVTCGSGAATVGVCLPSCTTGGCRGGNTCIDGQCVPVSGGDSGSGGAGSGLDAGAAGDSPNASGATALPADCTQIDFASYATGETISFRNDLLPMFGLSCVTSDCHGAYENSPRAGLNLGNKCSFDTNAKWKCTFPTAADPTDETKPAPDDPIVDAIYASVTGVASTVPGGSVKRVVPGDPANSFFLLKLADQQNMKGYACTNTDPSHESNAPPCGVSMPQNQDLYCQGTYRPRFDAIARWIAEGAPNN